MSYQSKYTGQEIDNGINPVGTIISLMRKTAPEGYLICDGRELNIADYPALSTMFEEEFGSKNIYGGDGITTFAIPDLRNEFLRGYYGDKEEQLSGEIGIHQDPTEIPNVLTTGSGNFDIYADPSNSKNNFINADETIDQTIYDYWAKGNKAGSTWTATLRYTTRPTNVAVLYCIKY